MKKNTWLFFYCFIFLTCTQFGYAQELAVGIWRATLQLEKTTLPFNFEVSRKENALVVAFLNGEERLETDKIFSMGDSIHIPFQLFDTELVGVLKNNQLIGEWRRYGLATPYRVPFTAKLQTYRFFEAPTTSIDVTGTWEVDFLDEKGQSQDKAVGIFKQKGSAITGTFLTTTGDYRYLQGDVKDNRLYLSTFDASHAYVFQASLESDGTLKGDFFAGKSGYQAWKAKRNEKAALPDANSLTFLKKGYDNLAFTFPDLQGKQVSLTDEKYKGKVVVVQLLGSWCPNCMDETSFLAPFYTKNKQNTTYKDFEIIGLAFEKSPQPEAAKARVEKMKQRFAIQYELLLAGVSDKQKAATALPMLSSVVAFPTTIFIDKKGKVRKIHTGFSGKATGEHYTQFTDEFTLFVEKLLSE